jgi:antitoxin component of MazEF toxin-antitoxin module
MTEGYAGSRKVLERGGSLTVGIPKATVERYGIEKGDDIFWSDRADNDRPMFIPPGQAEAPAPDPEGGEKGVA